MLSILIDLLEAGEQLVPLTHAKQPIIRWKAVGPMPPGRLAAYADVAELWARVIPEGTVVLDLDDGLPPPAGWPVTRTWATPRGTHVAYLSDTTFRKRPVKVDGRKVDILPAGTFQIIVGPSRELVWDWPPVPLPEELEAQLVSRAQGSVPSREAGQIESVRHRKAYIDKCQHNAFVAVRDAPVGTRNATLLIEAKKLAKAGAGLEKSFSALAKAARLAGLSEREIELTFASGWRYGLGDCPPSAESTSP